MFQPAIRSATLADVPALHVLVESAYRGDSARGGWTHEADLLGGQRIDAEGLSDILADPRRRILVAEGADGLVGCVELDRVDAATAYLGLLSVSPAEQARGLGRRLLATAEATAAAEGALRIEMTVIRQRPELIAWYVRRGYAPTGEERPFPLDDPRFGLPRTRALAFVVLAKPLAQG